jgi:hypothetical protein
MTISILKTPMRRARERSLDPSFPVPTGEVTAVGLCARQRLWQQMARECEAMVQHALSTGRTVPAEVIGRLDQALSVPDPTAAATTPARHSGDGAPREDAIAGSGLSAEMSPLASLSVAHAALAHIIRPQHPKPCCCSQTNARDTRSYTL